MIILTTVGKREAPNLTTARLMSNALNVPATSSIGKALTLAIRFITKCVIIAAGI